MTSEQALAIVRSAVGTRRRITRVQMRDILREFGAQGLDLRNGYLSATFDRTSPFNREAGGHTVSPTAPEAWANMCDGITCISVMAADARDPQGDGHVRYDQPGSMHPEQHATVTFAPAELSESSVIYMRRHADRVLIVSGEQIEAEALPSPPPAWIARLRSQHPEIDGEWARVLDDGTLELRDPNDGQDADVERKRRHQYRVEDGYLIRRTLPPASLGDAWEDIGVPEWEPIDPPPVGVIRDYWETLAL